MQGLIVKDLLNIKKQFLYYAVFFVLYFFMAVKAGMGDFFGTMVSLLCAMLPITALAYDERAKWDRYALAMPISRRDIVLSKYILGLILCGGAFVLNVLYQMISGMDNGGLFIEPAVFAGAGLFFLSIILPLLFRFGVERGRILMILIAFLPAAGISALPGISEKAFEDLFSAPGVFGILLFCALCFTASIFLSFRIYLEKEIQ